ncbi:hypothetical protein JCM6882_002701 [Rhodosporidiobolus microsporus]
MDPSSSSTAVPSSSSSSGPAWSRYLLEPDNQHPSPLSGTQDLLTTFHLDPVYNTFLRPYLDPSLLSTSAAGQLPAFGSAGAGAAESPAPTPGRIEVGKGKGKAVASPAPPMAAASPAPGGGLKITLGGVKFGGARGGSPSPSPSVGPAGAADGAALAAGAGGAGGKPAKRLKMEKGFEWMVGDVLGLPPTSRRPTAAPNFLQSLILNPDPTPCPPLAQLDPAQLREAFMMEKGGLAGFDMGVWERRSAAAGEGGTRKKKKKRKNDHHPPGDGSDPKKQRR